MVINSITVSILIGLASIVFVSIYRKKFPNLMDAISLFLAGELLYGGISSLWFGISGKFLLTDTISTYRIFLAVGGIALLYIAFDIFKGEKKKSRKRKG